MKSLSMVAYKSYEGRKLIRVISKFLNKLSEVIYEPVKRFFDFTIALVGIIVASPIFIIVPILIKLDSKGKVFFKHKRIGQGGKVLYIYKFRTMVEDAESLIKKFSPEERAEYEKNYKLKNDFRITRIGKILRKTSIDEIPQLFNILKGDMSIIGPRPVVQKELIKYGQCKERFLSVKPGLTGYWQANGRSNTTYNERIDMELHYVNNRSFKLDGEIFLKTISSVLKGEGAM